jgi:hypothetical protein
VRFEWTIGNIGADSSVFVYAFTLKKEQFGVTTWIVPSGNVPMHLAQTSLKRFQPMTNHSDLFAVVYQKATFTATLHADIGDKVKEANETNNVAMRTLIVQWST